MSKAVRVGVLGAGRFANNQHLPNLSRIDDVEIVAICDVDKAAAHQTAATFAIPKIYTDGHAMLEGVGMDALWSIVPAFARTDVEATAAARGIHIFSEKPQALEMAVARRLDEAIREAGVFGTVCFRERYRPIFIEARRLLEGREVTHIRFQSIRGLPETREPDRWDGVFEKGGSAFFDWGPHAVDYSRYVSGLDVKTAQAFFAHPAQYRAPTSASFNFQMSNGGTMTMNFVCTTPSQPPEEPYFLFCYEGGYLGVHNYARIDVNGETVFKGEDYNPWFELDRRFCEAVRSGDDSNMLNDYHDGLYSLAPVLAGWESQRRGGVPIDVEEFMMA